MHTKPFRLTFVRRRYYADRKHWELITQHIPRADAKWIGQRLALLSESQIRDSFQTAGYTPNEVDRYTKAVQKRIQELNAL